MPTLLEVTETDFSGYKFGGQSLIDIIERKSGKNSVAISERQFGMDPSFVSIFRPWNIPPRICFINEKYKFIFNKAYSKENYHFFNPPPPPLAEREIYNLKEDSLERNNLSSEKKYLVQELSIKIEEYLKQIEGKKKKLVKKPAIDKQLREKLKALGYIK